MLKRVDPGTVYLVGAGPGDPDLITVKGLHLLRMADVVVYDRLVHPDLLRHARRSAELIYVGKAPNQRSSRQDEINRTLIDQARLGRIVVRLKGGDPFVFGRGGEECLALASAGIRFQVVPGITSPIAVPAYAGIPVTHRGVSSAFTVVTGHSCREEAGWAPPSQIGTLIILMGLRGLSRIAADLVESGWPSDMPVAVIESGTTGSQRTVVGTLDDIGQRAKHLDSPATIVIGEVVALRPWLAWLDDQRGDHAELFAHTPPIEALAS